MKNFLYGEGVSFRERDCSLAVSLLRKAARSPYGLNTHFVRVKLQILFTGLRPQKNLVAPSPPRGLGSDPLSFEYKKGLAFS